MVGFCGVRLVGGEILGFLLVFVFDLLVEGVGWGGVVGVCWKIS